MANYSTPGVYVEEISTFPATVVRVATAVPVFIGYTELSGSAVNNIPTKVGSLVEYEALFGGEPTTYGRDITVTLDASGVATNVELELDYYLYHALRHFYANGGGDAYIMSVGAYSNSGPDKATLIAALTVLEKEDEPTLILIPDAFGFTASNLGDVQEQMLAHCSKMQDRFAILDVIDTGVENTDATAFRTEVGANNMKNGAAYYPALATSIGPNGDIDVLSLSLVDEANAAVSLSDLADDTDDPLLVAYSELVADLLTIPASAGLSAAYAALTELAPNVTDGAFETESAAKAAAIRSLIDTIYALPSTLTNAEAKDWVLSTIGVGSDLNTAAQLLLTFDIGFTFIPGASGNDLGAIVDADFDGSAYVDAPDYALLDPISLPAIYVGPTTAAAVGAFQALFDDVLDVLDAIRTELTNMRNALVVDFEGSSKVIADIVLAIRRTGYTLPPCGAMAGVYASVDAARGVWKAPANVSLNAVRDVRKLSGTELDDLNVSAGTGKSINAIRLFTGQGILVYGARTLAGNDNEWRYIPVRRLFIMVEESVRKAMEPMVFEPNDANTWVKVKGMVESFLNGLWRDGALAGGTPEAAFFVKVGLGQTMTAQDILEGKLIVEIGMAAVRPAEFIVLKFSHMLQTS